MHESKRQGRSAEFKPPELAHLESIMEAIIGVVPVAEHVVHELSADSRSLSLRASRLEGAHGGWAWPLVSRSLFARLQMSRDATRVSVKLLQSVHRTDAPKSTICHDYELEAVGSEVTTYGHSLKVKPSIGESFDSSYGTRAAYNQANYGRAIIKQSLGENQELRAGDCDYLFDEIISFWSDQ